MAITDLTGTSWTFYNGAFTEPETWGTFSINGTFSNESTSGSAFTTMIISHGSGYNVDFGSFFAYGLNAFTFTGGSDRYNSTLINWLVSNATQVIPYDLSQLGLDPGTYPVTCKARADGYAVSDFSNSVSYSILHALCFTASTAGSTIELIKVGEPSIANTAYSYDGVTWTTFTPSATSGTNVITLANIGDTVYFKNDITASYSSSNHLKFVMSGSIEASGNCNSMYSATGFTTLKTLVYQYCYYALFQDCTALTKVPQLLATSLSVACYSHMFKGCTNLTTVPTLSAVTLADYCYAAMFYGCSKITYTMTLPATTLAQYCYSYMFYECTSLTGGNTLYAVTLAAYCCKYMFARCTALTRAGYMSSVTTLAKGCCYAMYLGCTALTTGITLRHANTLMQDCYAYMFSGCTKLYISDAYGTAYNRKWWIPYSGTFTNTTTYDQTNMFFGCLGTRSSDTMSGTYGTKHIYYSQNYAN